MVNTDQLQTSDFSKHPLEVLELSPEAHNPLAQAGIRTLGELVSPTERQINSVKAIGISKQLVGEIKAKYTRYKNLLQAKSVDLAIDQFIEPEVQSEDQSKAQLSLDNMLIEELDLSIEALEAFTNQDIFTVGQLAGLTDKDFTSIAIEAHLDYSEIRGIKEALTALKEKLSPITDLPVKQERMQSDVLAEQPQKTKPDSSELVPGTKLSKIVELWLSVILGRAHLVISLRFGFEGEPQTLRQIGDQLNISWEEVRRIESTAKERLTIPANFDYIRPFYHLIARFLVSQGGLVSTNELVTLMKEKEIELEIVNLPAVLGLLAEVSEAWTYDRDRSWLLLPNLLLSDVYQVHGGLVRILSRHNKPLQIEELIDELQEEEGSSEIALNLDFVEACARNHSLIEKINGTYALKKWRRENEPQVATVKTPPKADLEPAKSPKHEQPKQTITKVTKLKDPLANVGQRNAFYDQEQELREQLANVDFIGELLIDRREFDHLCEMIQEKAVKGSRTYIKSIPPALFVCSMVFTARYSDENARNFWAPYTRLVWGFEKASQSFQNKCRRRFIQARHYLEEEYGFSFPRHSEGDVVRPVYRHAIIPFYLQDEFAEWLQKNWREILELGFTSESPEDLVPLLRTDKSVEYLPPTLRTFIQGDETADTAASLIINMATAAKMFDEGESVENISDLLSSSPIEQALWNEFAQVYVEEADTKTIGRSAWKPQWVWSFTEHEMRLRLQNVTIAAGPAPNQIVWTAPDENPLQANVSEYIDPWEMESGEWWIDEATIADGPLPGKLVLLTESNTVVGSADVSQLPTDDVVIFRGTQQGVYGIPIDYTNRSLASGDWFVSLTEGSFILDQDGHEISPREPLPVPAPLEQIAGHRLAGRYQLALPVTVQHQDQVTQVLERQKVSVGQPQLIGHRGQFSGLSLRVPPAFPDFNIWLVFPEVTDRLIRRTTVWLKSSQQTIQKPLRELVEDQLIEINSEDQARVNIGELLPPGPGTYSLQLRQSLKPLLPSPLQFSVLPDIQIQAPDLSQVYSPSNLPSCLITGLLETDVIASERHTTTPKENGVLIKWHDLRDDCRLQLRLSKQHIPLAWEVKRLYAWLDPKPEQSFLTKEDLKTTTYHVISPPGYARYFQMWLAGDEDFRKVDFDARGKYSNVIGNDALYDMTRQQKGTRQAVFIGVYEHKWQLFELRRQPQVKFPNIAYDDKQGESIITFRCQLEQPWEGHFEFRIHSLDRPLSAPQIISETTHLKREHRLHCTLSRGSYLLEILNEGEPLSLNQLQMRFVVGDGRTKYGIRGATALLEYLRDEKREIVPKQMAADYVQIMLSELEQIGDPEKLLTPIRRFHLACLPISSYEQIDQERIDALWSPLARIAATHQVADWEKAFGLLPAWAVLNQPMRMKLGQYGQASIKVYPEVALLQGQTGIGFADLKIDLDASQTTRVYARWSSDFGQVTAGFGLSESTPDKPYSELDELDLWPIYFCTICSRLFGKRGNITPDDLLFKRHFHGRENPRFSNILIDTLNESLPAELWPQRRDEVLQYTYQPSMAIDRTAITTIIERGDRSPTETDLNPISRQSYRFATSQWLERYYDDSASQRTLNSLIKNAHWQTSMLALCKRLVEYGYDTKVNVHHEPMFRATGRFISGFRGASGNDQRHLIELDRNIVALAFVLRSFSYYPSRTKALIKQVRLTEDDLIQMLDIIWQVCPELLSWSLTWIELFYKHALA